MSKPTAAEVADSASAGLKALQDARRHGSGAAQVDLDTIEPDPRLALHRAISKHYDAHPPGTDPDGAA